jgi:hypothetical protein
MSADRFVVPTVLAGILRKEVDAGSKNAGMASDEMDI